MTTEEYLRNQMHPMRHPTPCEAESQEKDLTSVQTCDKLEGENKER